MHELLKITHGAFAFDREWVLKNINLSVFDNEILFIKGGNGAGKTTLLKVLSGLLNLRKGNFQYLNESLKGNNNLTHLKTHLSYLGHGHGNYSRLSALENLKFFSTLLLRNAKPNFEGILKEVNLNAKAYKKVHEFSAGMKKRLAFALLLMQNKKIWCLDEPFAQLDVSGKQLIKDIILKRHREGQTIILSSHEHHFVEEFSTRIVTLENGQINKGGLT